MPTVATSITKERDVYLESQTHERSHQTKYTIQSQILTCFFAEDIYPEINSEKLVLLPWDFKLDFIWTETCNMKFLMKYIPFIIHKQYNKSLEYPVV